MIEAINLTKKYGAKVALDHVSLRIEPGEIVGLLGPNGAGKSTMMRILSAYMPPTEGSARMAGLDVMEHSLDVRRKIGYLPESNPLYEELAVLESLEWMAALRGLEGSAAQQAIRSAIDACALSTVVGQDIGTLSKGFRQRVGFAQAILHDPEILILDEPTSGLDPNQQREVHALIQSMRQKKTVLLSTHTLSEASDVCDRVIIIHRGRIAADGTLKSFGRPLEDVFRELTQ